MRNNSNDHKQSTEDKISQNKISQELMDAQKMAKKRFKEQGKAFNVEDLKGTDTYKRLFSYAFRYKLFFVLAIAGMIGASLADIGFAAMLKPIINEGFIDSDSSFITWMPYLIILLFIFRGVGVFFDNYFMTWVSRRTIGDLREELFAKTLNLPTSYFDNQSSSSIISKIIYDVEQVATACTNVIKTLVKDLVLVIGLFFWLLILDAKLTMVIVVLIPLCMILVKTVTKRFRQISHKIQDSIAQLAEITKEVVLGHKIVKTYGGDDYELYRFKEANDRNIKLALRRATVSAVNLSLILLLVGTAISVVLFMAMNASSKGDITPGGFVSYLTAMMIMISPTKRLAKVNETLQAGVAGAASMFSAIDELSEIDHGKDVFKERVKGKVHFDNVSFSYDNVQDEPLASSSDKTQKTKTETVLSNIDFCINPGESVALVGASGSGKSTIVSLLLRFYDINKGKITLDDLDIQSVTLKSLREQVAMVSQDIVLFNDTIKNNIVYGSNESINEEKLAYVCQAAHLNEFISTLPDGLETLVGERGTRLSGGQRQRLAIARAFYKNAPILVMDEATSALDSQSEKYVQEAVEAIMQDRTSIIIAHRLSTIRNVDKVIVLDKGNVIESGSIDELMQNKNGAYYHYYKTQFSE